MLRSVAIGCLGVLVLLGVLEGCGGGGGESEPGVVTTQPFEPVRATATLPLTDATAPEVAAQTMAVLNAFRRLGYHLAYDLVSVSPESPLRESPCGTGGLWSVRYVDADGSRTQTAGDRIIFSAPGCSMVSFGNGSATATILEAHADGLADVRIVVEGGTLPYLEAWGWVPTLTGTLRMTADTQDLWIRSEGVVVFTPGPLKAFRAMNVAMRLGDDITNNPPSPGIAGSLDIAFETPVGSGRTVNVDTVGLVAGYGASEPPFPGAVVLRGAAGSRLRISDAAAPRFSGTFLLATDANGDGAMDASATIPSLTFLDAL